MGEVARLPQVTIAAAPVCRLIECRKPYASVAEAPPTFRPTACGLTSN